MRRRIRTARPSPAIIVAVVALVAALAGTAIAADPLATTSAKKLTKKKVKKIANKQINKRLPLGAEDIADGAVGPPELAAGAVGPPELAAGAVTTPKLGDGSVTNAKLAPSVGRIVSASVANQGLVLRDQAAGLEVRGGTQTAPYAPRLINISTDKRLGYSAMVGSGTTSEFKSGTLEPGQAVTILFSTITPSYSNILVTTRTDNPAAVRRIQLTCAYNGASGMHCIGLR